jgi:hypothetical protein
MPIPSFTDLPELLGTLVPDEVTRQLLLSRKPCFNHHKIVVVFPTAGKRQHPPLIMTMITMTMRMKMTSKKSLSTAIPCIFPQTLPWNQNLLRDSFPRPLPSIWHLPITCKAWTCSGNRNSNNNSNNNVRPKLQRTTTKKPKSTLSVLANFMNTRFVWNVLDPSLTL